MAAGSLAASAKGVCWLSAGVCRCSSCCSKMELNSSTGLCCRALDRLLTLFLGCVLPGPSQDSAEQHWAQSAATDRPSGCSSTMQLIAAQILAARQLNLQHYQLCELPAGERTPNWPHSTGVLLGLRPGSLRPGLLYRAAMEGATFSLLAGGAAQTFMMLKDQLLVWALQPHDRCKQHAGVLDLQQSLCLQPSTREGVPAHFAWL